VTQKYAWEVYYHIRVFLRFLHSLPRHPSTVTPSSIAAFLAYLMTRPTLTTSSAVQHYITSLTLLWPTAVSSRMVADAWLGVTRCRPLRPLPGRSESLAATASSSGAALLPLLRTHASNSIASSRLWLATTLLYHGFRPIETTRCLECEGLARFLVWRQYGMHFSTNFHLAFSKADRKGSSITPPDRDITFSNSDMNLVIKILSNPCSPAEATQIAKNLKALTRLYGLPNLYAPRYAMAQSIIQLQAPPGVARAIVEARLDHKPGGVVTSRYSACRSDWATRDRNLSLSALALPQHLSPWPAP
jgi:hypothetical protein